MWKILVFTGILGKNRTGNQDFIGEREIMNRYNIDKTKHYFAKMDIVHMVVPRFGIVVSNGKQGWVECEISEDRYKVNEGYKVTLKPIDPRFMAHDFYQMDFNSLLKDGQIIEKALDS
ncbi:MAG: hypothetical protein NC416_01195 [Eubacterium sp.]|nr:hypothetical protein [Eubacterium sp.]